MWDENEAIARGGSFSNSFLDELKESSAPATGLEVVPEETIKKWKDYADHLRKKFPHMKPDRIKKKVAAYFKINLT